MHPRRLFILFLGMGLACMTAKAQNTTIVRFTLPYQVEVREAGLPPADYEIRKVFDQVLQFVKDPREPSRMEVMASVFPLTAISKETPESTKVVLKRIGDEYYFDKVWIVGNTSGYEFVLPERAKERERERMSSLMPMEFSEAE